MSNQDEKNKSKAGLIVCSVVGGIAIMITGVCYSFISPALRKICLPYVPASNNQVKSVVQSIRGCNKILDLGSGDGRLVLAVAKDKYITAHGVELNPWLVWYSRLSAQRAGLSSNTAFYRNDLFKFDLKPYDGIIIFGVEQMMDPLLDKVKKEVRPGTTVVACRFPFTSIVPTQTIGSGIDTVWKYTF